MKSNMFILLICACMAPSVMAIISMESEQYRSTYMKGISVSVVAKGIEGAQSKCALTAHYRGHSVQSIEYLTNKAPLTARDCTSQDNINKFALNARKVLRAKIQSLQ